MRVKRFLRNVWAMREWIFHRPPKAPVHWGNLKRAWEQSERGWWAKTVGEMTPEQRDRFLEAVGAINKEDQG